MTSGSRPDELAARLRAHVEARGGTTFRNGAWSMMTEAAGQLEALAAAVRHLVERLAATEYASAIVDDDERKQFIEAWLRGDDQACAQVRAYAQGMVFDGDHSAVIEQAITES